MLAIFEAPVPLNYESIAAEPASRYGGSDGDEEENDEETTGENDGYGRSPQPRTQTVYPKQIAQTPTPQKSTFFIL